MANVEMINAKRSFYIPKGAIKIASKIDNSVAYQYNAPRNGKPATMAFFGNQTKPLFRYYFNTEKLRNEQIVRFFNSVAENQERKAARRKVKAQPHSVKVGDMFHTSWGYEQTQVEFYQVVELVGKATVVIRQLIGFVEDGSECKSGSADRLYAKKDVFVKNETIRKRVNMGGGSPSLKICSVVTAWAWDGKSKHHSWGY